ncbi:MAG TPA: hypothetical protein VFX59_11750 [Polyangiales bacterium]|nr:hypothetical protein [Polyangiales bacterium]
MHTSVLPLITRSLLLSVLVCCAAACEDDFEEPARSLDGAVYVPPNLDAGLKDSGLSLDASLDAR